jgi:hypothetical protein
MNKTSEPPDNDPTTDDELLPEYDFRGGLRGKYAARYAEQSNVVVLDPDVARAFPTAADVNRALRKLLATSKPESSSDR